MATTESDSNFAEDACYFCQTLRERRLPRNMYDREAMLASLDRLEALERSGNAVNLGWQVILNPDEEIVVHCKVGGRSAKAADFLRSVGFKKVLNLKGGILDWIDKVDPSQPKY